MKTKGLLALLIPIVTGIGSSVLMGCGAEHDSELIGKWVATSLQINRWDRGSLPPGYERRYEFFEDGTGTMRKGEKVTDLEWSTGNNSLVIKLRNQDAERYGYTFKDGDLLLTHLNNNTVIYTRRPSY